MKFSTREELKKTTFIVILLIFLTPYLFVTKVPIKTIKLPKIKPIMKQTKHLQTERKTILFWNSYWNWRHFQMGVGNRGFKLCPRFSNCYTTTRKSKLTDPHEIVDAIVFHGVISNIMAV